MNTHNMDMAAARDSQLKSALSALGDAIRARREQVGLSQDELGHLSGLHRTYVGGVERGERNVTLGSMMSLCRALQLLPHELLKRAGL